MLDKVNDSKTGAWSISTFDFAILYTKIAHDELIEVLCKLVDTTFNDTTRRLIAVGNKRAYWVKESSKNPTFDADKVKECLTFLIRNAYFRVGDRVFRQVIGIPMGSDPAPFFANLFLFYYECEYVKKLSREKKTALAKKFKHIFRFIDDLIAVNDSNEFEKLFKEIYPPMLELKKENVSNFSASFLDLFISIVNRRFDYKLFDKRDAFNNFDIVRFPFRCSNMPNNMFHSTISAEILRICRATKTLENFKLAADPFLSRMHKQGALKGETCKSMNKLLDRHSQEFEKYGLNKKQLLQLILEYLN